MKFTANLTQATLLKRSMQFMAEAAMPDNKKIMLRCPNLDLPHSCELLGTRIWYSTTAEGHYLPTWEVVEIDDGHLICINPELSKPIFIEAINNQKILEFTNSKVIFENNNYAQLQQYSVWLENANGCSEYVAIEPVLQGNDSHSFGYFPENISISMNNLTDLINTREEGHQASLFLCVMHTGVSMIKPLEQLPEEYQSLLKKAIDKGVNVIAYKVSISFQGVELTTKLPIALPETSNNCY